MLPPYDPASDQTYRLRWKNSTAVDLPTVFRTFRDNEELFDVSLGCSINSGGSASLRAHKLILAAYSPVFKDMLNRLTDRSDPFIYLKGISRDNLSHILDFIYNGSVNISKSNINSFLADAEELQIRGLNLPNYTDDVGQATVAEVMRKSVSPHTSKPPKKLNDNIKGEPQGSVSDHDSFYFEKQSDSFNDQPQESMIDHESSRSNQNTPFNISGGSSTHDSPLVIDFNGTTDKNNDDSDNEPVPIGMVGDAKDFIQDKSSYSVIGSRRRALAKCRICKIERPRYLIERHINIHHPTYLITPTPLDTLKKVIRSTPTKPLDTLKRVRRSSKKKPLIIELETGAEQQPSSHHSEFIQNDANFLCHTVVDDINPADTGNSMDTKENYSHIDEAFENIEDKCLMYGSSGKKKTLARCKLCSKEIRRDRRKEHIRVHHPSYVFPIPLKEQPTTATDI